MSSSSPAVNPQSPSLKTYFKTPEGRYKLQYEKTHPAAVLHYSHGKAVSQVLSIAYLKEKPANQASAAPSTPSASGVRSAAARLLGAGNGSRALSFVGGNGANRVVSGSSKIGGSVGTSVGSSSSQLVANYDGKGTYLIFNMADTLFISDLNSQDKDPIKAINFSNSNPVCHAFDSEVKDGHDLLIGLHSGDVYSVSLRQQLQDPGRKLVAAHHYNKDGANGNRCTCIAWVPEGDGTFVVGYADGNVYVYEKCKDGTVDCSFPVIKDQTQFIVSHARSSKSNPVARWRICQSSINNLSFSSDGTCLATVSRDGYLRVFDFAKEQLKFGGKSYYGALLCCAWSFDGKYILTGGEDDLVQVWSTEDRKIVAWGEGHNSWVSGVAFDSYWSAPNSEGNGENVVYRFGSVGQDTQLLLWDLAMDEIALPLRGPPGGSPTFASRSHSVHWDSVIPAGSLQPAPSMQDVPKISPLVAHRVHVDPLSGVIFTNESIVTISREAHIKIWMRPGHSDNSQSNSPDAVAPIAILKDKPVVASSIKTSGSSYKQPTSVIFS
ncbi:probable catabolite repression protein creC isoform X3 [Zingiber officinale]|uniref:probable catabolite repression protein creC isoform X3 n=1 Tax=Zingiber officinale TaxID=94328 RepID=UPI001C4B848F|nr:probable catabolite repression protein creC isoform X3 [Zingiber officinale]